ncbi:putative surface protein with fasciclin (FAS1) repeats [Rubricella aquisinus]|uniref:Putative surface protein with fasciclin (FAS1) repeats n=1 Tax=Rubricella aquisinus TaxID=2028108 RepID=A0A840X176_9RHOB|nr:fasciclin domain-containing protein [Rubricella aquisinus]MBB5517120.1 putative surface protein with fasciclin (FAS1) repeats [Rubricella aquisinus]
MFRKSLIAMTSAAALLTAAATPTMAASDTTADATMAPSILDVAAGNENFETLTMLVTAAGLEEVLMGEGPFTVFAPTDEAFDQFPDPVLAALMAPENREALAEVLAFHVVPGDITAGTLTNRTLDVETAMGRMLDINGYDGVTVDNATVIQPDIVASNGRIHVIDRVLTPTNAAELMSRLTNEEVGES